MNPAPANDEEQDNDDLLGEEEVVLKFDLENFIDRVKEERCIWDTSCRTFKVVHIEKMLKKVNFRDILLLIFFEFNLMFNPRTSFCEIFLLQ